MEQQRRDIQWFPGHMARTRRQIQESLRLVDIVIEMVDARIPLSSRNPELPSLIAGKPHVIALNKTDIADAGATSRWAAAYAREGVACVPMDCRTGKGMGALTTVVRTALADRLASWKAKGMANRAVRMMVVGIPNSGKSSLINRLSRRSKTRVEDRPGVTRGNQWVTTPQGDLLLDTPGVLWPKFEDQTVARHLAYTGAIRDQILNTEELACDLLQLLACRPHDAALLRQRYALESLDEDGWALLQMIGRKRGMLVAGGDVDTQRAADTVLDEFRAGRIGRITLEYPEGVTPS